MTTDLTLPAADGFVTLRVGAIIQKDDKFLMVGNEREDYCYSVGGRIQFGETAEEAVRREVFEETGVRLEIDRLGFIHENYFYGDAPYNLGKLIYEVAFFFYMRTPADFEPVCESFDEGGSREKLVWLSADSPIRFYPDFFRTELAHPSDGVRHMVTDERRK